MVKLNKNKGFTLAELLIVVAVIAVLVAVAIPTFSSQLEKSRQGVDISNLRGAFAAARIAQMDGKVGTTVIGGDSSKGEVYTFWYDPDAGELVATTGYDTAALFVAKDGAAEATQKGRLGKATSKNVVADTDGLNAKIIYTGTVPTVEKAILVQYAKNTTSGVWEIKEISFQANASGTAVLTAIPALTGDYDGYEVDSIAALNVPDLSAVATNTTAVDALANLTIKVTLKKASNPDKMIVVKYNETDFQVPAAGWTSDTAGAATPSVQYKTDTTKSFTLNVTFVAPSP